MGRAFGLARFGLHNASAFASAWGMSTTAISPSASPQAVHAQAPMAQDLPPELPGVAPVLAPMEGVAPRRATVKEEIQSRAPMLPDAEGKRASASELDALLGGNVDDLPINTRCMALMALIVLQDSALQQVIMHERLRRTWEQRKNIIKEMEIEATQDRITGDRKRTFNNFCGSLGGVVASVIPGYIGNIMCLTTDGLEIARGQALIGISQSLGNMTSSGVSAWDKLAGGGRMADDADVRSRYLQREQDMTQQVIDVTRGVVDAAKQQWQKAQQSISEMNERRMQAISMVTR